ncbi:MAG: hypothetical protein SangKO_012690 [Sandaracinaceae bacterium]|nr:MAG: GNAT family N-acetyltransferase [Sandaracinaceae bacterium]
MSMSWIHESPAEWDGDKARIVGGAPPGVFDPRYAEASEGSLVPGEWWRVERDGRTVGYGWLDVNWGDAEILLAVDASERERGVGSYILEQLAREARGRGLNYLYNVIRPGHPDADRLGEWLRARGFVSSSDGRLLRAASSRRPLDTASLA